MRTLNLSLPDRIYDHLRAVALFEGKSPETFAKEILVLAEQEIWKIHGTDTTEMLEGLNYFNKHCR